MITEPTGLLFQAWPLCITWGCLLPPLQARQSKEREELGVGAKTWALESDPESNPSFAFHWLYDLGQDIYPL